MKIQDMKKQRALLGIDIGTSGLKISIFSESGRLLSHTYRESKYIQYASGHREQLPEEWWNNLCSALKEILSRQGVSSDSIKGIGICGFHHCPVFLKENGKSARPVILMHDERLPQSRQDLVKRGILKKIENLTQSMVSAGHFPVIFHYIRTYDSKVLENTRWILLAKDYLRYRLTGEIGTELCDATGTNLISPGEKTWSFELCEVLSVPVKLLPHIGSSTDIAGKVTPLVAKKTGLVSGTPVVYGGGDSHCALLGLGCVNEGDTGLLLGTNSTLRTVFNRFVSHPQTKVWVQHHVVPSHYTVSASSMAGASVLNWFKENFYRELRDTKKEEPYQHLEKSAVKIPVGSDGVLFLPYIYGERSPFYNPDASGGFLGIRYWHKKEHLLRSVFEGIALHIGNCYDLIQECAKIQNVKLHPLKLGGGGSRMKLWHQIIADCLDKPINIMAVKEAGTLGAALLAGIGVGMYSDYNEAVSAVVRVEDTIEPNRRNFEIYLGLKERLNDYYRRLQ